MAEGEGGEDRTEAATPRRLQRAREEGRVPISRELNAAAGLMAAVLMLAIYVPGAARDLASALALQIARAGRDAGGGPGDGAVQELAQAVGAAFHAAAPPVLAIAAAGAAATLLQSGLVLNASALQPRLGRLSPLAGIGRLLGPDNGAEAVKSLVKLCLIGAVSWRLLRGALPAIASAAERGPESLLPAMLRQSFRLCLGVLAVQALSAGADVLWTRMRHARSLRMSREEIRQETRETDGDPRIKARIRQIRAARARRRMMAAVPQATVVVTNPTHYAVALIYRRGQDAAPRVVAKGVDEMAARIRDVARSNRVPLVSNPPLARALFRVELETAIPAEHFQAVAAIIAYVWRLDRRVAGARA